MSSTSDRSEGSSAHPDLDTRVYASLAHLRGLEHSARRFSFLPRQPSRSALNGRHASRVRGLSFGADGIGVLAKTALGPLGPVTPPAGIALSIVFFAAQMAVSRWWLARLRFGPFEWLWRTAAYGSLQPWRLAKDT